MTPAVEDRACAQPAYVCVGFLSDTNGHKNVKTLGARLKQPGESDIVYSTALIEPLALGLAPSPPSPGGPTRYATRSPSIVTLPTLTTP